MDLKMLAAAVPMLVCAAPAVGAPLSEDQATHKAVEFLRGGDYGNSFFDVIAHFRKTELVTRGWTQCGPIKAPVWAFNVHSPYDGWLYLDAQSGEKICSTLPFYR